MAQGKITDGWNVSLGYDYLSSSTTKTAPGGPPLGLPLAFTPHNNLKFWTTYQVLPQLQIGGGGEYVGLALRPDHARRSSWRPAI